MLPEKINNFDKPLFRLIKRKQINNIRNKRKINITDPINIKKII